MRIIIGAGETSQEGWLSTQEEQLNVLDKRSFDWISEPVDAFLCEHVWEHMTLEQGIEAARNCYNVLKPGGYIRCAVPDVNFRNEWYQNMVQVGGPGPEDHPAFSHKIVYDYMNLKYVFEQAGFVVELLEYCDEQGNFHYKDWSVNEGRIGRSFKYDTRNSKAKLGMVSIIIDAKKERVISYEQYGKS